MAGHMVRNDTDHHDHIEGITGKGEGSFYRSREVKELAKILKDRYGGSTALETSEGRYINKEESGKQRRF